MGKDTRKIIQSLTFMASRMPNRTIGCMKAYKLLWLADRCHLRNNGRTITGDQYFAMPKGVVPTDAKHLLDGESTVRETPEEYLGQWIEKVGPYRYKAVADADLKEFSETDIEILEKVIEHYGNLSGQSLSELSHKYPEWKKYKGMLSDKNAKNSFPIDMDLMFENSDEDNSPLFGQSQELLEETKEIFHEFNRVY